MATQQMVSSSAGDELTPNQIDQLLGEATARLQKKNAISKQPEYRFPELSTGVRESANIKRDGKLTRVNIELEEKTTGFRKVEDPVAVRALAKEKKTATAGALWYDLPKTDLTPELKRDLQLIKMRGVLDPHRHYKKESGKMQAPEYSMIGTIKEGATEFYSARIENKKRKHTLVEQVLAGEQENGRFKRKYGDLQDKRASGKKGFYKKLQAKRFNGVKKGG